MNHKLRNATTTEKIIGALIFITIILMMHLQLFIQLYQHRRAVSRSSDILLNQVIEKIVTKDISEINMFYDLRSEYIIRANIVAYIIEKNPTIENNLDELNKICRTMSLDEIHFFNDKGEIYGGTIPAYYGMNFDSGEQMAYFKPMLTNKGMSMCQEPTPNTAEGRSMIYTIVWKRDGSGMIQIGVTPLRYYKEVNKNAIPKIIAEIPVAEGIELFVSDKVTGQIVGATDREDLERSIADLGIQLKGKTFFRIIKKSKSGRKEISYCRVRSYKNYTVGVIESIRPFSKILVLTLSLLFVYLCIAASLIVSILVNMNGKIQNERDKRLALQERMLKNLQEQLSIINGIGGDFEDIVLVHLQTKTASMLKIHGKVINYDDVKNAEGNPYDKVWDDYIKKNVLPDDIEKLRSKIDLEYIQDQLSKKDEYYCSYRCHHEGKIINLQAKFMKVHGLESESNLLFFAIRNIDEILEEQHKLAMLEKDAKLDRLTGFHNRCSYEDDITSGASKYTDENMVYVSMDVNGLKQTNDNFGHARGDDLLRGAASCMHLCFSSYGRVYRIGGDEFCAIIFADNQTLENILKDFDEAVAKWTQENNLELAVSVGYVKRKDEKDASILELSKIADKAMYYNKALFYKNKGSDRRNEYGFSSSNSSK